MKNQPKNFFRITFTVDFDFWKVSNTVVLGHRHGGPVGRASRRDHSRRLGPWRNMLTIPILTKTTTFARF